MPEVRHTIILSQISTYPYKALYVATHNKHPHITQTHIQTHTQTHTNADSHLVTHINPLYMCIHTKSHRQSWMHPKFIWTFSYTLRDTYVLRPKLARHQAHRETRTPSQIMQCEQATVCKLEAPETSCGCRSFCFRCAQISPRPHPRQLSLFLLLEDILLPVSIDRRQRGVKASNKLSFLLLLLGEGITCGQFVSLLQRPLKDRATSLKRQNHPARYCCL